jgi:serine/threonine protein kinase
MNTIHKDIKPDNI